MNPTTAVQRTAWPSPLLSVHEGMQLLEHKATEAVARFINVLDERPGLFLYHPVSVHSF